MFIYGFAGDIDVLQAELIGIIGLWHAWELGYRKVVCESDSQEAVRLIQDLDLVKYHRYGAILADTVSLDQPFMVSVHPSCPSPV